MPCVLPVLSLKILSVAKYGKASAYTVRTNFLASAAGIIFSFIILALLVTLLKSLGMAVGWGFQFQEPFFLIFINIILILFAANLWGAFEINLPSFLGDKITSNNKNNLASHFLSGAFATLLATPCSAPYVGTAISFAFSQGFREIMLIFIFMGIGLSLPYILIAALPGIATKLPKPGAWMIKFKYFLGLLLFFTALWVIWILASQLGNQIAILVLTISLLILALLFFKHYVKDPSLKRALGLIVILLCLSSFFAPSLERKAEISLDSGTLWQKFDEARIYEELAHGKTVFVDVTADWCLTCKLNKIRVLDKEDIVQKLSEPNIVTLRADWTSPDETIARYLKKHNRAGIPFNIVYGPNSPEGIALPELLTKKNVLDTLAKAGNN